jgi:uncharacterized protein (PEP-CTERM system associated)
MPFQQDFSDRRCHRQPPAGAVLVSALLLSVAGDSLAQDAGTARRAWSVEPTLSLRETFTDNYRLQTTKASDAITEATAGVRVTANAGMLRGSLDYSLTGSAHSRHSDANEVRHFLNAASTAELVQGFAFVDLRANYAQQVVSAFGSQSPYAGLDNSNERDVATLQIAPRLQGRLGGLVRYEAFVSAESTRAKNTSAGDVDRALASLHLDGGSAGARLGWTADASHNTTDFLAGRRTYDDRLRAGVNYQFTRELKGGVTVGQERTDLIAQDGKSYDTWGLTLDWLPSERTTLAATAEKRFFGNAHSLTFAHRTPSTVWTLSTVRDISTSDAEGVASFGSAYDLFFRQFASAQPDVVQRDLMVRTFLQANGIDPRATVIDGFLASAVTLQSTQAMSVALVGVRNTITLRATASRSERADRVTASFDDLSTSNKVRERGVTLDWAHRLTPASSITLAGSYQRSEGDLATQLTTLKAVTASWSAPLGARSTVLAGARHAVFDSTVAPYTESAVFAAVRLAF